MSIGMAIASGVSGIAQGAINAIQSRRNTDKTIKANKQMAEYQYNKDLEMWQRQNEYNNPASQMFRLKEAGLNPNMVYGNKGVTGNTSSQMPKYQAPRLDYNYQPVVQNLPSVLSGFQDYALKQATIDNVREQNKVIRETANIRANEAMFSNVFYRGRSNQRFWQGTKELQDHATKAGFDNYTYRNPWSGKMEKINVGKSRYGRQADYQLEYQKERNRKIGVGINEANKRMQYMDTRIDYQNKVNELYNTIALSKLGFGLANQAMKVVPVGRALQGAKRIGSLGKMGSATKRIMNNKWQFWRK